MSRKQLAKRKLFLTCQEFIDSHQDKISHIVRVRLSDSDTCKAYIDCSLPSISALPTENNRVYIDVVAWQHLALLRFMIYEDTMKHMYNIFSVVYKIQCNN